MHTFLNVLIQFFMSSTCFGHHMFPSIGTPFVHALFYGMFFMHLCKQSSRWEYVSSTSSSVCLKGKIWNTVQNGWKKYVILNIYL